MFHHPRVCSADDAITLHTHLSGLRERAAVRGSPAHHIGTVSRVLDEDGPGPFSALGSAPDHRQLLPRVNSTCDEEVDFSS